MLGYFVEQDMSIQKNSENRCRPPLTKPALNKTRTALCLPVLPEYAFSSSKVPVHVTRIYAVNIIRNDSL